VPRLLKIILIIAVLMLLIISTVLLFLASRRPATNGNTANTAVVTNTLVNAAPVTNSPINTNTITVNTAPLPTNTVVIDPAEAERQILRSTAVSFTQIYGSYSTHQPYANIASARVLMSQRFRTASDRILADHADDSPTAAYYGLETTAVSVTIGTLDLSAAEIAVSVQRRESVGTSANARILYDILNLTMVKEQNQWRVDAATWESEA